MTYPLVSVVIETVTAREEHAAARLVDQLRPSLEGLNSQTWPLEAIERIVVVDPEVPEAERQAIAAAYPTVRFAEAAFSNYFEAKNAGARAASGEYVALIDGDCAPERDWIAELMAPIAPGVAAVAGKTRYGGKSWAEKLFSIPDFAQVLEGGDGQATGFNINNLLFRREVLLSHPFEGRIERNGGCVFLFHQLKAAGKKVVYNDRAAVWHGNDVAGLGFARKHFERGYDSVTLYRLDQPGLLKGTAWFRRLGPLALLAIFAKRSVWDFLRLARHHRQMGVPLLAVPFYWLMWAVLRVIELSGALMAALFGKAPAAAPA